VIDMATSKRDIIVHTIACYGFWWFIAGLFIFGNLGTTTEKIGIFILTTFVATFMWGLFLGLSEM